MGGGNGGGFGTSEVAKQIESNARDVAQSHPLSPSGYFGESQDGTAVRSLSSEDPSTTAQDVFRKMARGAETVDPNGPDVFVARFRDGSAITYRPVSRSRDRSPAVEIHLKSRPQGIAPNQKIHFVQKESQ